jgi:hypothetical protein
MATKNGAVADNSTDWLKTTGGSVLEGAVLGSVIPGVGTAVGAAAGAVVGLGTSIWNAITGAKGTAIQKGQLAEDQRQGLFNRNLARKEWAVKNAQAQQDLMQGGVNLTTSENTLGQTARTQQQQMEFGTAFSKGIARGLAGGATA